MSTSDDLFEPIIGGVNIQPHRLLLSGDSVGKMNTGKKIQPQGAALFNGGGKLTNGFRGQQIAHSKGRIGSSLIQFFLMQKIQALPQFFMSPLPPQPVLDSGCGTGHGKGYAVQPACHQLSRLPLYHQRAVGGKAYHTVLGLEPADTLNHILKKHGLTPSLKMNRGCLPESRLQLPQSSGTEILFLQFDVRYCPQAGSAAEVTTAC